MLSKVLFQDILIAQGGDFGSSESSVPFGDACSTTLSPSVSPRPSNTPSISNKPSTSVQPSAQYAPSVAPTEAQEKQMEYIGDPCVTHFTDGKCTECTRDCDTDNDCAGSLRCAFRGLFSANENVPGCVWGENSDFFRLLDNDFCKFV